MANPLQAIYSLEYYIEDVGTVAGRLLQIMLPQLESLALTTPEEAERLALQMLTAIEEPLVNDSTLRETFSGYCDAIGVEWIEN